jgi:DNA modification methylase
VLKTLPDNCVHCCITSPPYFGLRDYKTAKLEPVPCTVLDIFSGAATTGLVAIKNQRNYIGIELNPEYVAMSKKRIDGIPVKYSI